MSIQPKAVSRPYAGKAPRTQKHAWAVRSSSPDGDFSVVELFPRVQEMRERFYGLAPDALATIEYAMREQKDARIAYDTLRDVGVVPRKGEEPQLPATAAEDGYSRQAVMIANVLLEARDRMGVELPAEVEEALAQDAQESAEAAKMPGAKLSRR